MKYHRSCRVGRGPGPRSFSAGAADPVRRFQSIDVFQLEYADDVQISPDGSRIVYVRVSHDVMTDRARRNLWLVNADGTNNRPLRSESKNFMSPRWSPDGTRLAYVSAAEGLAAALRAIWRPARRRLPLQRSGARQPGRPRARPRVPRT